MVNVNKNVNIFSVNSNHHRTSGTRTYTRALGQHSVFSQAGWHGAARSFNAYDTHTVNLNRYSHMRQGLNNYWEAPHHQHYGAPPAEQKMSFMEQLMAGMMISKVGVELGKGIVNLLDAFGIGDGKKTGDVKGGNGAKPGDGVPDSKGNIDFNKIGSFSEINTLQEQNLKSLEHFNTDYQSASAKAKVDALLNNDVKNTLTELSINLGTEALTLSEVSIDQTSPNFDTALNLIDTDIEDINTFVSSDIKGAQGKLSNVISNLTTNVAKLTNELTGMNESDANYASKKSALETAEKDLANAKAAQAALTEITNKCTESVEQLEAKKAEVQTAQENHNKLQDKRYNMAKEQDEKLGKVNAEIEKLNAKISKLGTPDADSKDQKKLNELRAKLTSAYNESTALITSLKSVAGTKITNSAGTEYEIKNLALNSAGGGGGGATQIIHNYAAQGVEDGLQAKNGLSPFMEDYD